jgi:pimeloyl-ACP methyl ester carboxylesterase
MKKLDFPKRSYRSLRLLLFCSAALLFCCSIALAEPFTDNGNGTVTDSKTGLMWQQAEPGYMTWGSALSYCEDLSLGGHSDWRLPNIKELESITDDTRLNPAIDTNFFPNAVASNYWSSTTSADGPDGAWDVFFYVGLVSYYGKGFDVGYVRCVRGGQSGSLPISWKKSGIWTGYQTGPQDVSGHFWKDRIFDDTLWSAVTLPDSGSDSTADDRYYRAHFTWDGISDLSVNFSSDDGLAIYINGNLLGSWGSGWRQYGCVNGPSNCSVNSSVPAQIIPASMLASGDNVIAVDLWNGAICCDYYLNVTLTQLYTPGALDHFEFSTISSPKSVGVPFSITITAKDANNTGLNWGGQVQLSSSAGANSVSPTNVSLTNGQWTGEVRLNAGGNNMSLTASIIGISGYSNAFSVTGATSNFGKIAGDIRNNGQLVTDSVTVVVSNNSNYYDKTVTGGIYDFTDMPIACGVYDIYAVHNGTGTQSRTYKNINVPCDNQTVTRDIVIPSCSSNKVPVILIPGIMGSAQANQRTSMFPGLPKDSPEWDSNRLEIHAPRITGWVKLKDKLEDAGYDDCTIYEVPFDWRMDIDESWCRYLKPWIEEAKNKTGQPYVDVIAHSMGGLLTRAYIQSDPDNDRKLPECRNGYENDIRKFAMAGTPNTGSAKAYYLWEGGDPKLLDDIVSWGNGWGNFYWNVTEKNYEIAHDGKDIASNDYDEIWHYFTGGQPKGTDTGLKGLMQLLPSYPFLEAQGSSQPQELKEVKNEFLLQLNDSPNKNRMGKSGSGKIDTKVFLGFGGDTIRDVKVQNTSGQKRYRDGWIRDGEKSAVFDQNDAGDTTVLFESARFPAEDGWADEFTLWGCNDHKSLIKCYADYLVNFLTGTQTYARSYIQTLGIESSDRTLSVHIQGRVKPYLIAPTGEASGIHYATSARENAIPSTSVHIDSDASEITVENPADGTYTLYLSNVYNEDYTFGLSYLDSNGGNEIERRAFNHSNTITISFTLNAGTPEKIMVTYSPVIPVGLKADAVNSGSLKTRLTWDLSSDSDVTYNIYSKYVDDPYLSHMGATMGDTFDTGDTWAENSAIKTRIYAVSAVNSDGTESFLSGMVQNNDRDHDGLTDEQEVSYGTNLSNPDSDGDGLKDGEEYARETNPLVIDTDGDGFSDYEEVQTGTDPLDANSVIVKPARPSQLTSKAISSTQIILGWSDNSASEQGFKIERKLGACNSTDQWSQIKIVGKDTAAFTNTKLNPNTTYSYRVRAYNVAGNSAYSNCASAKTGVEGSPKAPASLKATSVSTSKINVCWKDDSTDETGFRIYRKVDTDPWKLVFTTTADVKCYSDTSAAGNTGKSPMPHSYRYYVKACKDNICSRNTTTAVVPYKPTNIILTASYSGL